MDTTIIQTPISKSLRDQATLAALDEGFGSLQDAIRMFLKKLSVKQITFSLGEKTVLLSSDKAKLYDSMVDEILSGKVKAGKAKTGKDLVKQLHGNSISS